MRTYCMVCDSKVIKKNKAIRKTTGSKIGNGLDGIPSNKWQPKQRVTKWGGRTAPRNTNMLRTNKNAHLARMQRGMDPTSQACATGVF